MRINYLPIALVMFLLAACATTPGPVTELFPVKAGQQYGYMDRTGKMVIQPQFSAEGCFSEGLACACNGDENAGWGYINRSGAFAIAPHYRSVTSFSEGIAFVVTAGESPVAIDKTGTVKFKTSGVQEVGYFREDYAAFSVLTANGEKWGFMDKEGVTKITPQFTGVGFFSGGMCAVIDSTGKWGYIDRKGALKINYQYVDVSPFSDNRAAVCVDGQWGAIDNTGKYLVEPKYTDLHLDKNGFVVDDGEKFGWLDNSGKVSISPQFERAFPFNGGKYAPVRSGGKWGYIDHSGKMVVNPQFDFAFGFDGNLALVQLNHKEGFLDESGKLAIPISFDDLSTDYYTRYFVGISSASSVITNKNEPLYVSYKWLTKFFQMDFEAAKSVSTEDTKNVIDQVASLANMIDDSTKQQMMSLRVAVREPMETVDKATVAYTTSDNPGKAQTLYLVKQNGKWLVQFSKDDVVNSTDSNADGAASPQPSPQ